jgi:hypothetical protein
MNLRKYIETAQVGTKSVQFDSSSYWKDRYEAAELERSIMSVNLQDLQREYDQLKATLQTSRSKALLVVKDQPKGTEHGKNGTSSSIRRPKSNARLHTAQGRDRIRPWNDKVELTSLGADG